MKDNNKDIRILKYLRVSLDDEGDDESNSISYQREFLDSKRAEIVNKIETFECEMEEVTTETSEQLNHSVDIILDYGEPEDFNEDFWFFQLILQFLI